MLLDSCCCLLNFGVGRGIVVGRNRRVIVERALVGLRRFVCCRKEGCVVVSEYVVNILCR